LPFLFSHFRRAVGAPFSCILKTGETLLPLKAMPFLLFLLSGFSLPPWAAGASSISPGIQKVSLKVQGVERTCHLYIPASYRSGQAAPLVVMLHGGGGTGRAAMWESGWADKAEKEGFWVAFPDALPPNPSLPGHFSRNPQLWNDGSDRFYPGQQAPDDVTFLAALLDYLVHTFSIDPGRVFFTGFSNGASMTFLSAAKMPERIAAIAPVAGALWFDPPRLRPPVSLLYITGTEDPLNPLEGGVPRLATGLSDSVRAKAKPPVRDSILKWARALNGPEKATVEERKGVRIETYGPGDGGSEVIFVAVPGLGHTWPGGRSLLPEHLVGKQSEAIIAVDLIWDFFQKHSRKTGTGR